MWPSHLQRLPTTPAEPTVGALVTGVTGLVGNITQAVDNAKDAPPSGRRLRS